MPQAKKRRRATRPFRIAFFHGNDEYTVTPVDAPSAGARKAFRLEKLTGAGGTYLVLLAPEGARCPCKGWRYRGRCRHLDMLRAARMLD